MSPNACPGCGVIVGSLEGRCPQCGTQLGPLGDLQVRPPAVSVRSTGVRPAAGSQGLLLVAAVTGVLLLGAAGLAFSLLKPAPAPPPPPSAAPPPLPTTLPGEVDPVDGTNQARKRARLWRPLAALVAVEGTHVMNGRVEGQKGGTLAFTWGVAPEGALPGAPVTGAERLLVTVSTAEPAVAEQKGAAARVVSEPICSLDEAWRKAVAGGLPRETPATLRYAHDAARDRPVWTATAGEVTRTLDGESCAILVR